MGAESFGIRGFQAQDERDVWSSCRYVDPGVREDQVDYTAKPTKLSHYPSEYFQQLYLELNKVENGF